MPKRILEGLVVSDKGDKCAPRSKLKTWEVLSDDQASAKV